MATTVFLYSIKVTGFSFGIEHTIDRILISSTKDIDEDKDIFDTMKMEIIKKLEFGADGNFIYDRDFLVDVNLEMEILKQTSNKICRLEKFEVLNVSDFTLMASRELKEDSNETLIVDGLLDMIDYGLSLI